MRKGLGAIAGATCGVCLGIVGRAALTRTPDGPDPVTTIRLSAVPAYEVVGGGSGINRRPLRQLLAANPETQVLVVWSGCTVTGADIEKWIRGAGVPTEVLVVETPDAGSRPLAEDLRFMGFAVFTLSAQEKDLPFGLPSMVRSTGERDGSLIVYQGETGIRRAMAR